MDRRFAVWKEQCERLVSINETICFTDGGTLRAATKQQGASLSEALVAPGLKQLHAQLLTQLAVETSQLAAAQLVCCMEGRTASSLLS
jgi:hypothetical protein